MGMGFYMGWVMGLYGLGLALYRGGLWLYRLI